MTKKTTQIDGNNNKQKLFDCNCNKFDIDWTAIVMIVFVIMSFLAVIFAK